jgi:hypothetical protein
MESPSPDLRVDRAVLAESDAATLAWAVIEPAYNAVSFYDGLDVFAASMSPLTPGQRALLALHWCVAEVSNGGFDQFFLNPLDSSSRTPSRDSAGLECSRRRTLSHERARPSPSARPLFP